MLLHYASCGLKLREMETTDANGALVPECIEIKEELEIIDNEDVCMEIVCVKEVNNSNPPPLVTIRDESPEPNSRKSSQNLVALKNSSRLREKKVLKGEPSSSCRDKLINPNPKISGTSKRYDKLKKVESNTSKKPIPVGLENNRKAVPKSLQSQEAYRILKNSKILENIIKKKKTEKGPLVRGPAPDDFIKTELDKRRELNEAVYQWFLRERYRGTLVNEPMIQQKAIVLKQKIGGCEFTPTNEWLQQWRLRYNVRLCSDSATDDKAALGFIQDLKELIRHEDFRSDQIFSCGVTGLNYRLLPTKKLDMKLTKECITRYWENSDRLSFMCCSNTSGTLKFPLMIIGTSEVPKRSRVAPQDLAVYYKQHPKGWIDSTIFIGWFQSVFCPTVIKHLKKNGLPRRALLILDIAPFYPPKRILENDKVTIFFLPSNVKSVILPNQRFLESIKTRYRFHLLTKICHSNSQDFIQCLKEVKLVDVFNLLAQAWNDVTMVKDTWNHLFSPSLAFNISKLKCDIGYDKFKIVNGNSFWMKQLFNICSTIDDLENVCRTDVELWSERDDQTMCSFDDQNVIEYAQNNMINNKAVVLLDDLEEMPDKSLTENFETAPMIVVEAETTAKEAESEQSDIQNIISANQCQQYLTEVMNYFKNHSFATPVAEKDIEALERLRDKAPEAKLANYCFIDCGSSSVNER
ncbi:jerky protein homolog-like [Belonocnema kinseyi]|uniref:jerky protein homolog-like n=1 Tax=Belonocnema kinseyi TaxID=2817044 RepID=UPI00143DAF14|nr:jerky protein homolog-like [Belonocnema kinseyi]